MDLAPIAPLLAASTRDARAGGWNYGPAITEHLHDVTAEPFIGEIGPTGTKYGRVDRIGTNLEPVERTK